MMIVALRVFVLAMIVSVAKPAGADHPVGVAGEQGRVRRLLRRAEGGRLRAGHIYLGRGLGRLLLHATIRPCAPRRRDTVHTV